MKSNSQKEVLQGLSLGLLEEEDQCYQFLPFIYLGGGYWFGFICFLIFFNISDKNLGLFN